MKPFLTKVELPMKYQPLVDIAKSRVRMGRLVKSLERKIRLSQDAAYILAVQKKLDKVRIIRDEMEKLEKELEKY